MKTLSKKLLSLLLVAVMLVAAMPVFAFADEGGTGTISKLWLTVDNVRIESGKAVTYTTSRTGRVDSGITADEVTALLTAAGLNETYPLTSYNIAEAVIDADAGNASIKLTTKTVEHHYTVLVSGSGTADGHLLQCDGTTCGNANCRETTRVAHGDEHFTLSGNVDATCTQEGNTGTKTYDCGYVEAGKAIAKRDHNFGTAGKGQCATCGAVKYIVNLTVDGTLNTKELVVEEGSKVDVKSAAGVLAALNMDASKYTVGGDFTNIDYVITFSVTTKDSANDKYIEVELYYDNTFTTKVSVRVGSHYSDYDIFKPSSQDGRVPTSLVIEGSWNRPAEINKKTDNDVVVEGDKKVRISWNADIRKVYFYSDSTLASNVKTISILAGKALGELPTKVNGKTVAYWTVWGERITSDTLYKWNSDSVQAVPHFEGETNGKVYLEIYVNGNRTSKYTQVDITHKLQDGFIYRDKLLDTIRSATKNNSLKLSSVSYLFEESDWSSYVRNTNNTTTKTSVYVGENLEDARYIYVMVNGVTTKTTDPSNPKTGDSAKLGVAAAVLAVAVVGFGAVTVISKKKGAI